MKPTPVNLLNTGRSMRKCSRCRRLKAVFPSSTSKKAHGGVSDVCWTCTTKQEQPERKGLKRHEPAPTPPGTRVPARPGRPNKGSVWMRGGIAYAVVTIDGKTRRVSSGSGDRADAQALLARLLAGDQKLGGEAVDRNCTETPEPSQNLPTLEVPGEGSGT